MELLLQFCFRRVYPEGAGLGLEAFEAGQDWFFRLSLHLPWLIVDVACRQTDNGLSSRVPGDFFLSVFPSFSSDRIAQLSMSVSPGRVPH